MTVGMLENAFKSWTQCIPNAFDTLTCAATADNFLSSEKVSKPIGIGFALDIRTEPTCVVFAQPVDDIPCTGQSPINQTIVVV